MLSFKKRLAGGLALALAGTTALAACASSSTTSSGGSSNQGSGNQGSGNGSMGLLGQYGTVPAQASGTEKAGNITVGIPPNSTPSWIMPQITSAGNSVFDVTQFDYQLYRPLYWLVNGVAPKEVPAMSLANAPVWSNNDQTVTFTLKSNYKWSDGKPITSQDVLFWYYLLKAGLKESPANWAYYVPGVGVPDEVSSVTAPNATTVTFNLSKSVNPTWFWQDQLGVIQPMPSADWETAAGGGTAITDWATNPADAKKIYDYLAAGSKALTSYASNPLWQVVNGPFKVTSFDATSGQLTLSPNATYGGPHATNVSTVTFKPFTSDAAEYNAVKSGAVTVGYVPLTDVPQMGSLSSQYNEFGYADFGWSYVTYNFADKTGGFNNIIKQLYIRQALAHLENEPGYVKAFFYAAGGQGFGPVPAIPQSPYTPSNALTNPYPYNPQEAASILRANGWNVVPNGVDTCTNPGTGTGQCGAGIAAGTKLEWNVIVNTNPAVIGEQVQDWASQAKTVGIKMDLSTSNFNYMIQNYNDPAAPKNDNKWAMEDYGGFTDSTYPTTFGVFNSQGSSDTGLYSDQKADQLINASVSGSDPNAVTAEAQYLTQQQPSLFQPNPDDAFGTAAIVVWSKSLSGTPESFENITQAYMTPEYWFFTK
jgi:peptide/nickel transport system substrate-binding protein